MDISNKDLISNLQNSIKDLKKIQAVRQQILTDARTKNGITPQKD